MFYESGTRFGWTLPTLLECESSIEDERLFKVWKTVSNALVAYGNRNVACP